MGKEKLKKPFYKKWWFWLIVVVIVVGALGSNDDEQAEPAEETASQVDGKKQDTEDKQESAKEEDKKSKEVVKEEIPKEQQEKPQEPVDQIEDILIDTLGKETNMDKKTIVSIENLSESDDSLYYVLTFNANENFTNNMTKTGILMDSKDVLEQLSKIKNLNQIVLKWRLPLTDQYGNTKDGDVLTINIERDALDKINWENFNTDNFKNVAKNYFEHPAFKD